MTNIKRKLAGLSYHSEI